jgi:hypothetical protein
LIPPIVGELHDFTLPLNAPPHGNDLCGQDDAALSFHRAAKIAKLATPVGFEVDASTVSNARSDDARRVADQREDRMTRGKEHFSLLETA